MQEKIKIIPLTTIALVSSILWFIQPEFIEMHSWQTIIIFLATIVAIVVNAMPMGAIGLVAITIFAVTGAGGAVSAQKSILDALSGFNSELIWLVTIAFFFSRGFVKTGLGQRIALILVYYFGRKTLGLAYALSFADLILAPATPSNTARSGGVIFPIIEALSKNYQSYPNTPSRSRIGKYLVITAGNISDLTGALFITAYAANPLIVKFAAGFGVELTWGSWFVAALVPVLTSLFFIPILLYFFINPEIKETPEASLYAKEELGRLGNISHCEILMGSIFFGVLLLWVFGPYLGMNPTTTALVGLCSLIVTGVLTWDDVKSEKAAWDMLIWLAALLMMADFLNKLGFTYWFGEIMSEHFRSIAVIHWILLLMILNAIYTYLHYFFASGTAQVAALYVVFLGLGVKLGIPVYPLALLLAFSSSLYSSLTPYAHARSMILFSAGYLNRKEWWISGFLVNFFNQIVFVVVGLAWWKTVGLY